MREIIKIIPTPDGNHSMYPAPHIPHMKLVSFDKCDSNDTVGYLYTHPRTELWMYILHQRGREISCGCAKTLEGIESKMLEKMQATEGVPRR